MRIAEYVRGRQRIVGHFGSAHTEALGMLLERARELLDYAHGLLDLGVDNFRVHIAQEAATAARPL